MNHITDRQALSEAHFPSLGYWNMESGKSKDAFAACCFPFKLQTPFVSNLGNACATQKSPQVLRLPALSRPLRQGPIPSESHLPLLIHIYAKYHPHIPYIPYLLYILYLSPILSILIFIYLKLVH
jgi:hypothetical protein